MVDIYFRLDIPAWVYFSRLGRSIHIAYAKVSLGKFDVKCQTRHQPSVWSIDLGVFPSHVKANGVILSVNNFFRFSLSLTDVSKF